MGYAIFVVRLAAHVSIFALSLLLIFSDTVDLREFLHFCSSQSAGVFIGVGYNLVRKPYRRLVAGPRPDNECQQF